MSAGNVARKYAEPIPAGKYDQVGSLWTDDAVFENPHGNAIRGHAWIVAFDSGFLRRITPLVRPSMKSRTRC